MAAKPRTFYTCQKCGAQSAKWMGRCLDCGAWDSLIEETFSAPVVKNNRSTGKTESTAPALLQEIDSQSGNHIPTGIAELDRVLGGGLVPASAVLVGGDPGIGKSTLILQLLAAVSQKGPKVLYITGEESAAQIKSRAARLNVANAPIPVLTENCLETILDLLRKEKPELVVLDSVQTIYSSALPASPGTVSQVRESTGQLLQYAKSNNTTCLLIGHVTKEGSIAGPKVLEHMVDCVLYFEGDTDHNFRILRAVKNRYGATNEIGVFEMTGQGLREVSNPSEIFLAERPQKAAGSVVVASVEGTRPVLLEVQALVTKSGLTNPRRTAIGYDSNRLSLLVAVLEKVVGLHLYDQDIFLNIAGGLKVTEPALDLGACLALYSSFRNQPIDSHTVALGEIGLTGEIRAITRADIRIKEAEKLGFRQILLPKGNHKGLESKNLTLTPVASLAEALGLFF